MADNYLITGYWGEPHVTVENDRSFNAAVFGAGKFVLPVGEMFRAEYIGNNTVRIHDGKLIDNGAVAGIPTGSYIDLLIPEAGQGMKRNDLIIFEYSKDASTLVESGVFKVLSGTETSGTAADPALTENNLLTGNAYSDQMALWRIPVAGAVISAPEILYNTKFAGERITNAHSEDGKVYTANLPGVAKLYTGLEITIIPDTTSATTLPSLNVNGIGDVYIKRRITSNTKTTVQSEGEEFLQKDQPIRVIYNGSAWVADMARANATDIYGKVPVQNGGLAIDGNSTDKNKAEALECLVELGATTMDLLWENPNPDEEFAEQLIGMDASKYKGCFVEYMNTAGNDVLNLVGSGFIPNSGGYHITHYHVSDGTLRDRSCALYNNGVSFTNGRCEREVSNRGMVPLRVWGMR